MFQSSEANRIFAAQVLEASFFGAFITAIDARKNETKLTQAELAERTGREKTGMSKLLAGPRNWKISTMSDLAVALDLTLEFALRDRLNPMRKFTATGIEYDAPVSQSLVWDTGVITAGTVDTSGSNLGLLINANAGANTTVNTGYLMTGTGPVGAMTNVITGSYGQTNVATQQRWQAIGGAGNAVAAPSRPRIPSALEFAS